MIEGRGGVAVDYYALVGLGLRVGHCRDSFVGEGWREVVKERVKGRRKVRRRGCGAGKVSVRKEPDTRQPAGFWCAARLLGIEHILVAEQIAISMLSTGAIGDPAMFPGSRRKKSPQCLVLGQVQAPRGVKEVMMRFRAGGETREVDADRSC